MHVCVLNNTVSGICTWQHCVYICNFKCCYGCVCVCVCVIVCLCLCGAALDIVARCNVCANMYIVPHWSTVVCNVIACHLLFVIQIMFNAIGVLLSVCAFGVQSMLCMRLERVRKTSTTSR